MQLKCSHQFGLHLSFEKKLEPGHLIPAQPGSRHPSQIQFEGGRDVRAMHPSLDVVSFIEMKAGAIAGQ
jgi:hypothetical protein